MRVFSQNSSLVYRNQYNLIGRPKLENIMNFDYIFYFVNFGLWKFWGGWSIFLYFGASCPHWGGADRFPISRGGGSHFGETPKFWGGLTPRVTLWIKSVPFLFCSKMVHLYQIIKYNVVSQILAPRE